MGYLFAFLFLVYLCVSAVLVLVVLVQSGKGGGLSGLVGAGTSLGDTLGATGAEKTLNKWTTYCAIAFIIVNITLVLMGPKVFKKTILDDVKSTSTLNAPMGADTSEGASGEGAAANGPATPPAPSGASAPAPETQGGSPSGGTETEPPPSGGGESGSQ